MTSEQIHPPLRMPDHLFAELAAGGGSPAALTFLEHGERARRLLLLRTALAHISAVSSPLGPSTEAWRALKTAADQAPDHVERLLLAPQTGGWLAHLLRRMHDTAPGPPLWAETGHLHVLAVTAALHAELEVDLPVPLVDGELNLPGLGLARLPGAQQGLSIGRARTKAGELELTTPEGDASCVCRPRTMTARGSTAPLDASGAPGPGAGQWIPVRVLTHTGPSGTTAIPLDDLGPYRDLDEPIAPDRLDPDEAAAWQELLEEASGLLTARHDPGPGRLDPARIRAIVPWGRTSTTPPPPPVVELSASSGDSFGSMVITRPATGLALAETRPRVPAQQARRTHPSLPAPRRRPRGAVLRALAQRPAPPHRPAARRVRLHRRRRLLAGPDVRAAARTRRRLLLRAPPCADTSRRTHPADQRAAHRARAPTPDRPRPHPGRLAARARGSDGPGSGSYGRCAAPHRVAAAQCRQASGIRDRTRQFTPPLPRRPISLARSAHSCLRPPARHPPNRRRPSGCGRPGNRRRPVRRRPRSRPR